jgi:Sulfate permease family
VVPGSRHRAHLPAAGVPGRAAVQAGAGRLPGRHRRAHGREPARERSPASPSTPTRSRTAPRGCPASRLRAPAHACARRGDPCGSSDGKPTMAARSDAADRHAAGRRIGRAVRAAGIRHQGGRGDPGRAARAGDPGLAWSDVASLAAPAVGIAVVAYSDNILTARAFATRNGYSIDNNQEMVALGVSAMTTRPLTGCCRRFPGGVSRGKRRAPKDGEPPPMESDRCRAARGQSRPAICPSHLHLISPR